MKNKRAVGTRYERIAGAYLEKQGYHILQYNFRCRQGEIDIVAREGAYLVFCEVKYRSDGRNGLPAEAVGMAKQRTISRSSLCYISMHGLWGVPVRFDVVGILGREAGEIRLYRDAFDYRE